MGKELKGSLLEGRSWEPRPAICPETEAAARGPTPEEEGLGEAEDLPKAQQAEVTDREVLSSQESWVQTTTVGRSVLGFVPQAGSSRVSQAPENSLLP